MVHWQNDPFCCWCRCALEIESATLEHFIPKSRGGQDSKDNTGVACLKCNGEKADEIRFPHWRMGYGQEAAYAEQAKTRSERILHMPIEEMCARLRMSRKSRKMGAGTGCRVRITDVKMG